VARWYAVSGSNSSRYGRHACFVRVRQQCVPMLTDCVARENYSWYLSVPDDGFVSGFFFWPMVLEPRSLSSLFS
jgi:hypothetical protein